MAIAKASRKYQLTINHPTEHGLTHECIKNVLSSFRNIEYWCLCDEIGESGTYHTHVYLYSPNAVQFTTVQRHFYGAHIEAAKGSHQENRDYIRKEGKWRDDAKHETNLPDTFEESGELPQERDKRETLKEKVYGMIEDGASNAEILRQYPSAMNLLPHMEATRQALLEEEYRTKWRSLTVVYLWGKTGTGKTRSIMERFGYENVYHVTNYAHPFDSYKGQQVILFDEFRSSLPVADMLKYLDGYPLMLPCRFSDKVACFTRVFIVSNIPMDKQYPNVQLSEPETFDAFLRRFESGGIYEMLPESSSDMPF